MQLTLKSSVFPMKLPWRKISFLLHCVSDWKLFLAYGWGNVSTSSVSSRTLLGQTHADLLHSASVHVSSVDLEVLLFFFFLIFSIPCSSYNLLATSSEGSLELLGSELDGDILLMAVLSSLNVYPMSGCSSVYLAPSGIGRYFSYYG